MALTQGSTATWADINSMYTTLRSIQSTHKLTQSTIPSKAVGEEIEAADLINLINGADSAHNESHLNSASYISVSVPAVGSLITSTFIRKIQTNINNMNGRCHQNSCSFCSDCGCNSECAYCWAL